MINIVRATEKELPVLSILLDKYRQFYKQASDITAASEFLTRRFANKESSIFLAYYNEVPAGFCQLYPSFSSVSLRPLYILNDLFVEEEFRKKKIGKALLLKAQEYCKEQNYKGLALETATDNPAQFLYEGLGWKKSDGYFHYFWQHTD